jgi:hypothetical protein
VRIWGIFTQFSANYRTLGKPLFYVSKACQKELDDKIVSFNSFSADVVDEAQRHDMVWLIVFQTLLVRGSLDLNKNSEASQPANMAEIHVI